jgi:hypothetical protein
MDGFDFFIEQQELEHRIFVFDQTSEETRGQA